MPQLGETVTEGTITRWFKQVGETVQALGSIARDALFCPREFSDHARGGMHEILQMRSIRNHGIAACVRSGARTGDV